MKFNRLNSLLAFGFTTLMLPVGAQAQTWDSAATAGIQIGAGTWSTAATNWTIDSGATRLGWTNGNAATFAGDPGATAAAVTLSGAITVNNITRSGNNAVSVTASAGNTLAISGTVDVGTGSRLNFIGGVTGGVTGSLVKTGAGVLELNGNDATLAFSSVTLNGGALGVINGSPLQSESLVLNAGAIGSTNSNTNRLFDGAVTVGGDIGFGSGANVAFGNGTLNFSNTINLGGATRTFTIGSDVSFNGAVSNGDLIKAGSGTLNIAVLGGSLSVTAGTVNASNTVSGGLSVTGGTVNVSNTVSGSVALSTGTLNLNNGATIPSATLSSGTFNLNAGATVTGAITTTATATVNLGGAVGGTVTLGSGDTLGLRGGTIAGNLILENSVLNSTNSTSGVNVSGNVEVTGTQTVNLLTPVFGVATTILSAGGTLTDTDDSNPANNFSISGSSSFRNTPFITTTGNVVQVTILAGDARTWAGSDAINPTFWDANTTANWSGGDSLFFNGDAVTFDDTATPATPVTVAIQGLLSPSAITFDNTSKAYTVSGASGNGIIGSTGLIKNGTGVLRLGGAGSTFSGNVQVNAGSLLLDNWEALGATGKTIGIASGAAVNINGKQPSSVGRHYTWNIAGDGVAGSGAITNSGSASFNNAGIQTLQLSANASLGGTGRFDIGRSGALFGTIQGNGFTLTKNGTNILGVRAPATNISYLLNAGTLLFEDSDAASGSNAITINGGTLLSFGTRTFGNNLNFTTSGAILQSDGNVGTWNGNISLNGNVTFRATNVLVINGTVSGSGIITKDGSSALRVGTGGTTGDLGTSIINFTTASRLEVNRSGSFTMANNITGLAGFSSLGSGTTTLTGNNTYTGTNVLTGGGTLSVNTVADAGGVGSLGTFLNGTTSFLSITENSTLRITGTGSQTSSLSMFNGSGVGSSAIDVVEASANITFTSTGGNISRDLIKNGAGTLSVAGGFFGNPLVNVNTGKLVLTGPASWNIGNVQVASGATLELANSADRTLSGAFSGVGSLVKSGASVLTLSSATSTFSGNTSVSGGTLVLADNATLGFTITNSSSNQISGTGVVTLNGDFNIDLAAVSASSGSWNLVNVGTLTESFGATFTIAGAGWTQTADVWTLVDGSKTFTFTEATGVLALSSGGNPFTTWIDGFTFAPGADKTPAGDPDADGLSNQQEYAFGLIPNDGSSVNAITVQVNKTAGTFTYTRRKPALTGLSYKVWTSTNLSTWTQDLTAVQSPTDVGDNQNVVVTLTGAPLTATKLFVRVAAD